jgi:hypothetical protein
MRYVLTALIRVSFDGNHPSGILFQQSCVAGDDGTSRIVQLGAVQFEEHRFERRVAIELVERPSADRVFADRPRYGQRLFDTLRWRRRSGRRGGRGRRRGRSRLCNGRLPPGASGHSQRYRDDESKVSAHVS